MVESADFSYSGCAERDRLREAYLTAVSIWVEAGGPDPDVIHLPKALEAKKRLDEAATRLIAHRGAHGC
jgi:hypothetical protein